MGISDIMGNMGIKNADKIGTFAGKMGGFLVNFVILIFVLLIIFAIGYYFKNRKEYKFKINTFRVINGVTTPSKMYKAKELTIPNTSIKVFQIQGQKGMYLPRGTIETGTNSFLYFIRNDSEWMNVGLENLNESLTKMNFHYDHRDMRYANSSLKELIKTNYGASDWLAKYGVYVALGIFVILTSVAFYLVADKLAQVGQQLSDTVVSNAGLMRELAEKLPASGLTTLN